MSNKAKSRNKQSPKKGAIVSDKVGNYDNDPFFIKKAEEAKAYLKKVGLPKDLVEKSN